MMRTALLCGEGCLTMMATGHAQVNTTSYLAGGTSAENTVNVAEHSAAVGISASTIAVADNESNTLRMYAISPPPGGTVPVANSLGMNTFLALTETRSGGRIREADFEGSTRLHGTNLVAWTASHSRSNDTVPLWRGNRHRLHRLRGFPMPGSERHLHGVFES